MPRTHDLGLPKFMSVVRLGSAVTHLTLFLACVGSSGQDDQGAARTACRVESDGGFAGDATVSAAERAPCELEFTSTGIDLTISAERDIDARLPIARTRAGDFVAASFGGDVNRWNAAGEFVGRVGTRGPGPEAFRKASAVFVDATDSIHISDPPGMWHVLDEEGRLSRTIRGPSLAEVRGIAFLDDGRAHVDAFSASDGRLLVSQNLDDPLDFPIGFLGGDRAYRVSS